jgi:hypothetical protein
MSDRPPVVPVDDEPRNPEAIIAALREEACEDDPDPNWWTVQLRFAEMQVEAAWAAGRAAERAANVKLLRDEGDPNAAGGFHDAADLLARSSVPSDPQGDKR